jgi:hypothetical protein
MSDTESIDAEIKRLERDKKLEELRQLRSGWTKWATPATILALLPFLVGFGAWALSEFRLYSNQEVFRQLEREKQALISEKTALQTEKTGLNIEIQTLVELKQHFAEETRRAEEQRDNVQRQLDELRVQDQKRQAKVDANYLKARFARDAADYALGHVDVGQAKEKLDDFRRVVEGMPAEVADGLRAVVRDYELAVDMIDASTETLVMSGEALDLLPASEWARNFHSRPSGYFIQGRQIMIANPGPEASYYDVDRGRLLTDEEASNLSRM